jgi:ketosteroid isomerase-like protein
MSGAGVTEEELTDLVRQTAEAAAALISGDIRRYFTLTKHADDFTLLTPFGGEPRRGSDTSEEALEAMAQFFHGGEASLELVQSYTSGDLAVLVLIERLHGEVGGMPDQDLSLRVTLVYRREGQEWRLVHRHADPLVHGIGLERLVALARGEGHSRPCRASGGAPSHACRPWLAPLICAAGLRSAAMGCRARYVLAPILPRQPEAMA